MGNVPMLTWTEFNGWTSPPKSESPVLTTHNIEAELWREYDFGGRIYRINFPKTLYYRDGGTTHRVVDVNDVVHCVPAPGQSGCVLRWMNKNREVPVNF